MKLINRKLCILLCAIFLIGLFPSIASPEALEFKIVLSQEKVAPGRQAQLYVIFFTDKDVPEPDIPFVEGLNLRFQNSMKKPIDVNGQMVDAVTYVYSVTSRGEGTYWIGPFSLEYDGDTYTSNDVLLEVTDEASQPVKEEPAKTGKEDISSHIFLEIDIPKEKFYVSEKLDIEARFYTDWLDVVNVQVWDKTVSGYVTQTYQSAETEVTDRGGEKFVVAKFKKWIFVPEPGEFSFGPVLAKCEITKKTGEPLNNNEFFYNRYIGTAQSKTLELESEIIKVNILPLPEESRPASFLGAVGSFTMDVTADKTDLKLGDVFTMTIAIGGRGNYDTVSMPILEGVEGFSVYEPQSEVTADGATFKQMLKVREAEVSQTPEVIFSFFDPDAGMYATLKKGSLPLKVEAPKEPPKKPGRPERKEPVRRAEPDKKEVPGLEEEPKESLGEGLIYLKDSPGKLRKIDPYFYKSPGFILLQIFPLLLIPIAIIAQKRMQLIKTDEAYAGWLAASKEVRTDMLKARVLLRKGDPEEFFGHVFKTLQRYLGARFGISPEGISANIVEEVLHGKVEREDIPEKIKLIFMDCFKARYTPEGLSKVDMKKTFDRLKEVINYLNSKKRFGEEKQRGMLPYLPIWRL